LFLGCVYHLDFLMMTHEWGELTTALVSFN
jgi:hypothetical protein